MRVQLARCDHTWRETLATIGNLFAGPAASIGLWEGGPVAARALNRARWCITLVLKHAADERPDVLMPSFLCPAVPEAVLAAGKRPRFVDIAPDLNVDAAALERELDDRVAAVVVPHMYGRPAPIVRIVELCRQRGVLVIDDAATATGIRHEGRWLGTFGDAGLFSLAQNKSIVVGQGGVLLLNNEKTRAALDGVELPAPPRWREGWHAAGWLWAYRWRHRLAGLREFLERVYEKLVGPIEADHGVPARMPGVWAAVARAQFRRLEEILGRRAANARALHDALQGTPGLEIPQYVPDLPLARFVVRTPGRPAGELAAHLADRGVETGHAYAALHLQEAFQAYARGPLPRTEELVPELLLLPVQGRMSDERIRAVADGVRSLLT